MVSNFRKKERNNWIVVGTLYALGAICFASTFYGRQTPLIEYCFKPTEVPNPQDFCTPDKRYTMPVPFISADQQPSNPKHHEDWQVPEHATVLGTIPATNPHKWAWGFVSTAFFGMAYGVSKAREQKLLESLPKYREEVKSSWFLNQLRVANQHRKAEYASKLDYDLWQHSADQVAHQTLFERFSPEQIRVYEEQARLQAQAETQELPLGESQALLPGQSLDDITNPGDKLEQGSTVYFPGRPEIPAKSLGLGIRRDTGEPVTVTPDGVSLASFMVAGKSGSGKSCLIQSLLCSMIDADSDYYQFFICEGKADYYAFKNSPHCLGYYSSTDLDGAEQIARCISRVRSLSDGRLRSFRDAGVTNLAEFNQGRHHTEKLPFLYLVCDELMNMFGSSSEGEETFTLLREIACLGRASGIGLIFADQRMKGTKNLNVAPIREQVAYAICGKVKGEETSKLLVESKDALNLEGKGDFIVATDEETFRMQAYLVKDVEAYIKSDDDGVVDDRLPADNPEVGISLNTDISHALTDEMKQALEWLKTQGGWHTSGAIRRGCRKLKDMESLEEVTQLLERLLEFELIEKEGDKFRAYK